MRIQTTLISVLLIMMASSCRYFSHENVDDPTKVANYTMMDSDKIFNKAAIDKFTPTTEGMDSSLKLFRKAEGIRIGKRNPQASLPLYLKSLMLWPKGLVYMKYADALYASEDYKTAYQGYAMSSALDTMLRADSYLGQARCESIQADTSNAGADLNSALEKFPYDYNSIKADKAFAKYVDSDWFKMVLANNIKDPGSQKIALFAIFERNFPVATLPYSIPLDSVYNGGLGELNPRYTSFIPDLKGVDYAGENANDFGAEATLPFSPIFRTFIYARSYYKGDTLNPTHHFIITLDQNDTLIAQQEIGCACSPMTQRTADISKDGIIEVKEYIRSWDKDPLYYGYRNNKITSQTLKSTTRYQIMADGKITAINGSAAAQ